MWRQWWRARTARPTRIGGDAQRDGTPAEREAAVRERLAVLELQRLELLADESVPGRRHRLDAVRGAQRDLEVELAELTGPGADEGCSCGGRQSVGSVPGGTPGR